MSTGAHDASDAENKVNKQEKKCRWPAAKAAVILISYFLVEYYAYCQLRPEDMMGLAFGGAWAVLLTSLVLFLPKTAGRIVYGVSYYVIVAWTLAQTGYYQTFDKLMWLTDMLYADEGAAFFGDVLVNFSAFWWIGGVLLLSLGAAVIVLWPDWHKGIGTRISCVVTAGLALSGLFLLPQALFVRDNSIWGTHSEYGQSSSYRASYNIMYNAHNVYDICGIYQLTFRDFWKHELYPLTPGFQVEQKKNTQTIDAFFEKREDSGKNKMSGIFAGKNVVLVLM
jgi:hypothetical protein